MESVTAEGDFSILKRLKMFYDGADEYYEGLWKNRPVHWFGPRT